MTEIDEKYKLQWNTCVIQVKQVIPTGDFISWVEPLVFGGLEDGVMKIIVPDNTFVYYIETNLIGFLKPIIIREFGGKVKKLTYIFADKIKLAKESGATEIKEYLKAGVPNFDTNPRVAPGINKVKVDSQLNFDLTFDNFIEGDCNRLARAAGFSVAQKPGELVFNPMFIYGDSGLGKTHVAQAIGIEVKKIFPDKNVLYVSTQKFVDQFTTASYKKEIKEFIKFYQMMDVLIIDDIQELSGKPQTQIAFFNIFNHLHQNKKQLIFTSDKSPVELKDIENRIISRFKWALSVQLSAPDFDTKVAIIESKAKRHNIELSQDVIEYLAENINSNVRELEGAISSFAAHSSLLKIPASIDLARKILTSYVVKNNREITIDYIKDIVCDFYKIKKEDFDSKSRISELVLARQVAMYLAKEFTGLSLKNIGIEMGNKTHATVVYSCKSIKNYIDTDKELKKQIEQLKKSLR